MSKDAGTQARLAEVRTIMADHGIPEKVLPENITDYRFDAKSGRFQVKLSSKVKTEIAGISVQYEKKISGRLGKGTLREISGVKAKQVLWVPVTSMEVEGDKLAFAVGPIRRRFPLSEFV
jgi:hypothetical protein